MVHEVSKFSIPKLIGFIQGYLKELEHVVTPNVESSDSLAELQRLPENNLIKVNFNASFVCGTSKACLGAIVKNDFG